MSNKTLNGWIAITTEELSKMDEIELSNLMSYCWRDGKTRCHCIGIKNIQIRYEKNYILVSWCDVNGDPRIAINSLDDKIDNVGDGEWNYGLYK